MRLLIIILIWEYVYSAGIGSLQPTIKNDQYLNELNSRRMLHQIKTYNISYSEDKVANGVEIRSETIVDEYSSNLLEFFNK